MNKKHHALKAVLSIFFAAAFVFLSQNSAFAQKNSAVVINMHGEINEALVAYLSREIGKAEDSGVDVVIIDIDTWGGFVFAAEEIHDILSETQLNTIAYISKKAVSAGVMVAISCDRVVMTPGSHSGAAETIPNDEKSLSAWVGMLTAAAEESGRPVDIVKAMADKREVIEGLSEEGELLDITAQKAVEYGYADMVSTSHRDALASFGYTDYETVTAEASTADMAARFLTSSTVLSILFVAGVFFMIIELFTAGFGLFGIIAIVCFALYFFGGVIAGYTEWWAVVLFILGAIFFVIEIIVPGFGIFGILGIVLTLLGLMFSARSIRDFVIRGGITLAVCLVSIPIMFKVFGRLKIFDRIILKHGETSEEGYLAPSEHTLSILGMTGRTVTVLRPAGMALIDGRRVDVLSHEGYIASGVEVKVIDTSGNRVVVEKIVEE